MLQNFILILCCFAASRAASTQPAAAPPQVYCGEIPNQIHSCLKLPKLFGDEFTSKCERTTNINTCEKMSCTLRKTGWLVDGKLNKTKISEYYHNFGVEHPEWAAAVARVQTACLRDDLPAQGSYINCPAFDIVWCALSAFIKNAQPSQWPSSDNCAYSKQYAASCPVCPESCFAPAIATGSCNACYVVVPTTP